MPINPKVAVIMNIKEMKNQEIRALIDDYERSARNRRILKATLTDKTPYETVAECERMSTRQIGNIVRGFLKFADALP